MLIANHGTQLIEAITKGLTTAVSVATVEEKKGPGYGIEQGCCLVTAIDIG